MRGVPLARRNLFADRRRLAASVVGVGLAVMLILLLDGMWAGMRAQARLYTDRAGADLYVLQPGVRDLTAGTSQLPLSTVDVVRADPGVTWAAPVRSAYMILQLHGTKVAPYVIGSLPGQHGGVWWLAAGRASAADDEIVPDRVLAGRHGIGVGDTWVRAPRCGRAEGPESADHGLRPGNTGRRSLGSIATPSEAESMRVHIQRHRHGDARPAATRPDGHEAAEPDRTDRFVCWLGDGSGADVSRVGVLGACLSELSPAGLAEPGFVVTTDAYLRALDQFGGRGALCSRIANVDLHDPRALARAAKTCQALVRSAEMPAAVHRSVLDAYARLERDGGHAVPVTVRSSPTPDSGESTSSAGMDVAFTDVRGGLELVDRIIDCWAARWSPQVVADRAARALTREPAIAVVVQLTGKVPKQV